MKSTSTSHPSNTIDIFRYVEQFECINEKNELDTEYNPHEHGNSVHAIGFWGASVHLIRSSLGTGILLAPFAFKQVGYGVAMAAMAFVSLLYLYNIHSILLTEYQLCRILKVPNLTFVGTIETSFNLGPKRVQPFQQFVKLLLYAYWMVPSANGIQLIVIAQNCRSMVEGWLQLQFLLHAYMTAALVVLVALCLIPKRKLLVSLSALANLLTLLNLILVSVATSDVSKWRNNGALVADYTKLPQFFAMAMQSLGMTGLVISLKSEMKRPKEFGARFGVLNVSFVALVSMVSAFGLVNYLNHGADVADNILQNLPSDSWVTLVGLILYTLSLCVTYTLMFYVYYDTIWSNFLRAKWLGHRYESLCKYCLRVCINVAAYVMAVAVPHFGVLASMVGTLGILVEIGLPSMLRLLVAQAVDTEAAAKWPLLCRNSAIILLAVVSFFFSLKSCIFDLIKM